MDEIKQSQTKGFQAVKKSISEVKKTFKEFFRSPRALWGLNIPYFLEGIAYFGVLTVLMKYLSENIQLGDVKAGIIVSFFTGGITFAMFFLGEMGDRFGIRKILLLSIMLMFVGRIFLTVSGILTKGSLLSPAFLTLACGLFIVVIGFGMFQPVLFSSVKRFTDAKSSAMAFAVIYGLNNLGAFCAGLISPVIRGASKDYFPPNGINGVFSAYAILTFSSVFITMIILRPRVIEAALKSKGEEKSGIGEKKDKVPFSFTRWIREHPMRDARFSFFIFILIPVQTLFAHTWLTLPLYINRAFEPWISKRFELFSNFGPLLVFLLAPMIAAFTAKQDTLKMIMWGTLVMAVPAFLLVMGPHPSFLFAYILLMTVGECMWQPRFLQYITQIAPAGKTGAYVGIGQFPWFLTKFFTGFYAGWFLKHFCPAVGPKNTSVLWFIYGCIAIITPISLFLVKKWLRKGMTSS